MAHAKCKITGVKIEFDAQAKGFIDVAVTKTTTKSVIHYKNTAADIIPQSLKDYAKANKVTIIQIEVK